MRKGDGSSFSWTTFGVLFVLSCLVRYLMEMLTNTLISVFREQVNWEKYWEESDCSSDAGQGKFVCKAVQLCIR